MTHGGGGAVPMDTDGEDAVVSTFPVYLVRNPDPGGALYLLQSPLRPAARPYALEECEEVRFKVRRAAAPATRSACACGACYERACAQQPLPANPRAAADKQGCAGQAGAPGAGSATGHAFGDV